MSAASWFSLTSRMMEIETNRRNTLNTAIVNLYNQYLQHTGDKVAAASLTLAELMQDEPSPALPPVLTTHHAAKMLRVSPDKILAWIRSGELRATNVASNTSGRPLYRIQAGDLAAFRHRPANVGRPRRA
jgi:excisionase family DNA binding protein